MTQHAPLRVLAFVLLGATLPLLSSCSGGGHSDSPTADALRRNRAVWAARNVPAYRYTLQVSCFCGPDTTRPVTIEVRGGAATSRTYADDGTPANPDTFARYDTMEKIFAVIQAAIDQRAARTDAAYDPAYGYPTEGYIDPSVQIADEELGFRVRSFAIIP